MADDTTITLSDIERKQLASLKQQEVAAARQLEMIQQEREANELLGASREALIKKDEQARAEKIKLLKIQQEIHLLNKEQTEALAKVVEVAKLHNGTVRDSVDAALALKKGLDAQFTTLLGLEAKLGNISNKLYRLGESFVHAKNAGVSLGAVLKTLGKSFATMIPAALNKGMHMFVEQTIGLFKAQDSAISSFRKATGATADYNLEIAQTERRNFIAGVTAKEAGAAMDTLYTSFATFTQLSAGAQAAFMDTTVLLNELGVGAADTAKVMDVAMRSIGLSTSQTNELLLDLAGSAKDLGIPMSKMVSDFASTFPQLAKYGQGAVKIFKDLEIQAKNTGLSVGQLVGIADKFDTFDSAGQAVGRLNALLGGPYLNSIDLLNANEEERIDILQRSTDAAGIQFDALNRHEKQAIAAAMGTNVDEAQRLFNMSNKQYKLESMKQKELQEQAREVQEIGKQLKSAFMALAVDLRPLVENIIVPLVGAFASMASWIGKATNKLSQFTKVALFAGFLAAVLAIPFTAGASLPIAAKLGVLARVGIGTGLVAGAVAKIGGGKTASTPVTPRFASGGVVTGTSTAIVGEQGPEMIEMPIGSRVTTAPATKQLTDAIAKLASKLDKVEANGAPQHISVYIGQEKIDEIVVNALDSPAGKRAFGPFSNA